jgi:hypothetical protein
MVVTNQAGTAVKQAARLACHGFDGKTSYRCQASALAIVRRLGRQSETSSRPTGHPKRLFEIGHRMLSGKSAIVTGSTSGIGLGIARGLAANGANVMLNGFGDAAEIEALRSEIADGYNIKVLYNGANMADG